MIAENHSLLAVQCFTDSVARLLNCRYYMVVKTVYFLFILMLLIWNKWISSQPVKSTDTAFSKGCF